MQVARAPLVSTPPNLVDAVDALHPDGPLPISWAKTANAFAGGRGMRIDHCLVSPALLNPTSAGQPCISAARLGSRTYGSDHAYILADFGTHDGVPRAHGCSDRRAPPPPLTTAAALAAVEALAHTEETLTPEARRRIATIERRLGPLVQPLAPLMEEDSVFLLMVQLLAGFDDDAYTPTVPPPTPARANTGESDCRGDDDADATDDLALAITAAARRRSSRWMPHVVGRIDGNHALELLVDTGAANNIIRSDVAATMGLRVETCDGPDHPTFLMADGSASRPRGVVHASLTLGSDTIATKFYVMPSCPFNGLLGMDFLERHGWTVNLAKRHLKRSTHEAKNIVPMSAADRPVAMPSCPVLLAQPHTLGPGESARVRVELAPGANCRPDGNTWGLFASIEHSAFATRNGFGNVAATEDATAATATQQANFVEITNTTRKPLKLARGTQVADFQRDDLPDTAWAATTPSPDVTARRHRAAAFSDARQTSRRRSRNSRTSRPSTSGRPQATCRPRQPGSSANASTSTSASG